MLEFIRNRISTRKLRLFACECCRRIWHRLPDCRSQEAIEVTESNIEGIASLQDLKVALNQAQQAQQDAGASSRHDYGEWAVVALALAPSWLRDSWPCI